MSEQLFPGGHPRTTGGGLMNRWTPIQVALYVVVPIATLVGYIVGAAWVVGHYR